MSRLRLSWILFLISIVLFGVIGVWSRGGHFFTDPLPVGVQLSRYWLTLNGLLSLMVMVLVLKNLSAHERSWTAQEKRVSAGLFMLALGACGAYMARAFGEVSLVAVSTGTPFSSIGLFLLVAGLWDKPDRFEETSSDIPGSSR